MFNKKILLLIGLVFIFVAMQPIFALTAESDNYSVAKFGTGIQATNFSSENFEARALLITGASTRNAENDIYTANIGFWGNTTYHISVSITSSLISPESAVIGSTISLYISALNAQNVWAKIVSPNGQSQTVPLVNNEFVTYNTPSIVGRYNVTFYANSSSGAIASVVDYFDLTEQVTPVTPPPSGGGGGSTTTIIEKCTYLWDCTPWGLCADGKQKRECKNTGTCNGTESKPIEEMLCSIVLFDIALKLKDIKLTENNTLKFNIDLVEKIGTEKIDVYIKYSIIDSNNNEIFSQIETKAVQGNLSYQNEIEDFKLQDGEYTLKADIFYGYQQRASAEQRFKVKNGGIEIGIKEPVSNIKKIMEFLNNYIIIIIIIIIIISASLYSLFIFRKGSYQTRFDKPVKSKRKYLVYGLLTLLIVAFLTIILKTNITGRVISNILSYNWKVMLILLIIISVLVLSFIIKKRKSKKEKLKVIPLESKLSSFESIKIGEDKYLEIKPKPVVNIIVGEDKYLEIKPKPEQKPETKPVENIKTKIKDKKNILLELKWFLISLLRKFKKHSKNSILGLINKKVYSESGLYIGKIKDIILGENKIESLKIKIDKKHNFKAKGIVIGYKQVKSVGEVIIISEKVLEYIENYGDI